MASSPRVPKYRLHKGTGYAYVQHISIRNKSRRLYLGKYGTPDSLQRYQQFLARLQAGVAEAAPPLSDIPTIKELVAAYLVYAKTYYDRGGSLSSQYYSMKRALLGLNMLFATDPAANFGPKSLRLYQSELVKVGYARSYVNQVTDRIKRFFRWACAEEMIDASVYHALACVAGLRRTPSTPRFHAWSALRLPHCSCPSSGPISRRNAAPRSLHYASLRYRYER